MSLEPGGPAWFAVAGTVFRCHSAQELIGMHYWETFGIGNDLTRVDQPAERFNFYQRLLETLQGSDSSKYSEMQKGTPFYFLGWLAFDLGNYQRAALYMDAALAEDQHHNPGGYMKQPAAAFALLKEDVGTAGRVVARLRTVLDAQIARFNQRCGEPTLTRDDVVCGFVAPLLSTSTGRSLITAYYSFLLEMSDRQLDANLRSTHGGSIESFTVHLFKGGLVFESILKHLYPNAGGNTLGSVLNDSQFVQDFVGGIQTRASNLEDIVAGVTADDMSSAFNTTAKLRNTTGHNLQWNDVFKPNTYQLLAEQVVNALLFVISRKFRPTHSPASP